MSSGQAYWADKAMKAIEKEEAMKAIEEGITIVSKEEAEALREEWLNTNPVKPTNDPVNHPPHYTSHPSGIECIQITEHMGFNLGNALKYIWRCDEKLDAIEDLKKAKWYIDRELTKREGK